MSDLGKRLKAYREKLGYTLKEVSKKTGITDSRLCKIENDHLSCPAPDLLKQDIWIRTISLIIS